MRKSEWMLMMRSEPTAAESRQYMLSVTMQWQRAKTEFPVGRHKQSMDIFISSSCQNHAESTSREVKAVSVQLRQQRCIKHHPSSRFIIEQCSEKRGAEKTEAVMASGRLLEMEASGGAILPVKVNAWVISRHIARRS